MSRLQIAADHCANFPTDGAPSAKTEREVAELYCEPRAYYHSVEFLEKEVPPGIFRFKELNYPKRWLETVAKYLALTNQGEVSQAAKQLYRLVEEARREFREAQDRAWGDRKVTEHTPENYDRRELAAWERFNHAKLQCLKRYERAIATGSLERIKRKSTRICLGCKQEPLLVGQRKCASCRAMARRERNRRYARLLKDRLKTGSLLGISSSKTPFRHHLAECRIKTLQRMLSPPHRCAPPETSSPERQCSALKLTQDELPSLANKCYISVKLDALTLFGIEAISLCEHMLNENPPNHFLRGWTHCKSWTACSSLIHDPFGKSGGQYVHA